VDADQVLAFRLARSGLAERDDRELAEAAACPASDFARDAALLALAARTDAIDREAYEKAVDAGKAVVVAHVIRGAIHAIAPSDLGLYGRALLATDEKELGTQLGQQVQRLAAEKRFRFTDALDEVAEATADALAEHRRLDKNALHEQLRQRVNADLMPWCKGCGSHHVAPMLWRFATVKAGARLDSERRYTRGKPGRTPHAGEAVRRFLRFYGPAKPGAFAEWAGLAKPHAQRVWDAVADELAPVGNAWLLADDAGELESPPAARGVRFLPAGDPYLQKPNRALLAPTAEARKRFFRPVASPGVVLVDGRVAGLWRAKKGEISVEKLGRLAKRAIADEAERVAGLRGDPGAALVDR
jgi:hypothetical protein